MGLYNRLLQRCELNRHTTEAAAGALQNITAGDRRVSDLLSPRPPSPHGVLEAGQELHPRNPCPVGGGTLRGSHGQVVPRDRALGGLSRGAASSGSGSGKGRGDSRRQRSSCLSPDRAGWCCPHGPSPSFPTVGRRAKPPGPGAGAHPEPTARPSADCRPPPAALTDRPHSKPVSECQEQGRDV